MIKAKRYKSEATFHRIERVRKYFQNKRTGKLLDVNTYKYYHNKSLVWSLLRKRHHIDFWRSVYRDKRYYEFFWGTR